MFIKYTMPEKIGITVAMLLGTPVILWGLLIFTWGIIVWLLDLPGC